MEISRIDGSQITLIQLFVILSVLGLLLNSNCANGHSTTESSKQLNVISALIRYSYTDPKSGKLEQDQGELGRYASHSPVHPVSGLVVHAIGEDGANHGCSVPINVPPNVPWIALVQRGQCTFHTKVTNAALLNNATAVVIYNNEDEEELLTMQMRDHVDHIVSVFVAKHDGEMLAKLADSGVEVQLDISIGQITVYDVVSSSRFKPSTLLLITVSLVGSLILGLVILLICGIRKTRSNKKKHATTNMVFNLHKPGQVHESLLYELDGNEHSSDQPHGMVFNP